jgi:hypothetical protein
MEDDGDAIEEKIGRAIFGTRGQAETGFHGETAAG